MTKLRYYPEWVSERAVVIGDVVLSARDGEQTQREKLARIVLDEMYQFVGMLDVDGNTLEINQTALSGAGVRLEGLLGKPFWEARWFQVSLEVMATTRRYVRRARQGEFVRCDLEVFGEAHGDQTIIVDFSLRPVRDRSGEVVFLLAEGRNITTKKQVESELIRKTAELQRLLDKVTQLDRLKSEMFANVSHELRTPLTLIMGPAEDLIDSATNLTDRQRDQLVVIQRNAASLLKHVDDLLDLAKLDSGKVAMRYVQCDLAAAVRSIAEQFHAVAPGRSIAYYVFVPRTILAEVDLEKIERVLLNLLSNAFKFTPSGGRIACGLQALDGGRALLTVQDSGPGVPAGLEQAIFERFRQVQQGTTREHSGSGLGLAIAKEFVDLHDGSISVSQAPGGGALFQVEIPLRAPEGTPILPGVSEPGRGSGGTLAELHVEAQPTSETSVGEGASVLLVEDNAEVSRFVRDALASEYRMDTVGDGALALARLLHASPPDLVITDLMLPGMGGDRLVDEMRAHPQLANIPVIVLSARGDPMLRSRLLSESVQDYLTKPFSIHELRARVRNLLSVKLARDQMQRALETQGRDLNHLTRNLIANQYALKESEQRWWAIYEHSPVGIALVTDGGLIRAANPAFRRMLGYSVEEIRECALDHLTPVEERQMMRNRLMRLLSGVVRDDRLQCRFHHKDGSVRLTNTSAALIPASGKAAPMLVLATEDITEQKSAERLLARTRSDLARVGRTSSLGELAASIAHEVNQPLAAIVTNGHACLRWLGANPPNEDEAHLAVQRIVTDANRAGEVIKRIRNFLRRGDPVRRSIDVHAVINDVLAMIRQEAQTQDIVLQAILDEHLPQVMGDAVQLQQVVLNLVMNALESISSSGKRQGRVVIRAVRHDDASARVDVRDTGAGLDVDACEKIFEGFYTTKSDGMGMGLAISQSIVDAHGGRLWATPGHEGGATFHFTIPFHAEDEDDH
ncbi:ATP-binding protein [Sinimarinibacterium sp. NLF-5-8]|uniref:ATP-binding protein n=1 Tax=Sinimarinibacterium sp. NLF-5-8 TaxID=2698684 RepID=UPI00137C2816|nr:ATP-binding protein [Sinimarinibacterium sp. NLF-5-8]QHS11102.1 PAS domain S-box protein [Sinimarinibacterium sp. NLF-5-8]